MAEGSRDDDAIKKQLDDILASADTGAREPPGFQGRLLFLIAVSWSLFQLWIVSPLPFVVGWGVVSDTNARAVHLAFALLLAYAAFPGARARDTGVHLAGWTYAALSLGALIWGWMLHAEGAARDAPAFFAMAAVLAVAAFGVLRPGQPQRVPISDWILALAAAWCAIYLFVHFRELSARPGSPTPMDLVVAGCGMVLLLEATRRALGPPLMLIGVAFLLYLFAGPYMPDMVAHRGASFGRAMGQMWLTAEGVFGIALGVSTAFVFLFVLFGSLLDKAGAGNYFIKVAFALLGHLRGGPAKAAVVASAMTGLISGSSIANVVTTGTFTIPLMKRVGFSPEKAGAVEVSSSVNGQIMPPVMGAAAFLMVEYVGIPYVDVIKHAFLPALISYIALLYIVHLEAMKAGMEGLPKRGHGTLVGTLISFGITVASLVLLSGAVYWGIGWLRVLTPDFATPIVFAGVLAAYVGLLWFAARYPELEMDDPNAPIIELPESGPTIKSGLHYILPIVILVWCLIVERLSPGLSAFWAVAFMIFILLTQRPITAFFRQRGTGAALAAVTLGVREMIDGLAMGARNMVGIGVATAAAGIVVGTIGMTPLSQVMTELVEVVSGGNLMLMLVLIAVICLVLGLGLPTTANYIIVATLMAPVVVDLAAQQGLIVPLIAVHLFVFYFGLMADVTPPVGLASFAAAAVSRGDPLRTGLTAFFYSLRTVALPFIFIFNTQLLMIGITGWFHFTLVLVSATVAMLAFAAATQGWFLTKSRIYESVGLLLVAFILFRPGFFMDMVEDEFERVAPDTIVEHVAELPANGFLRMEVAGIDMMGRDVTKLVMVGVGAPGAGQERLARAGLMIMSFGGTTQVANVDFGSQAERLGIESGFTVTALKVPSDRPAKEWMFLPGLALLGLIAGLQYPRRRRV